MKRPKIDYPCEWSYKVIGMDEGSVRKAITEALGTKEHSLSFSNKSSGGRYTSLHVKTVVTNEEQRNKIFASLSRHASVKAVL
ncbi:MAG: DUF493 domain-containing protein [Candidatus Omnitrophica bacterium]|nr:DUF493 domain-containing protein [Candidatus Omnitrophota bacterium]